MTRRKDVAIPEPFIVDPNGVYLVPHLRRLLLLRETSVRREVKAGRLRISKRCGRYYCLGSWILEWLAGGEIQRKPVTRAVPPPVERDQGEALATAWKEASQGDRLAFVIRNKKNLMDLLRQTDQAQRK